MPDQLVITDARGTRHVFPAGTDPQQAAQALRQQLGLPDQPAADPMQALRGAERITGPMSTTDRFLNALPMIGGGVGGAIGAAGGTAFGAGFGGVPGGIGGAAFGGATGEAVKQLGRRILGRPTPETPQKAAINIGTEGATQAALEAAGIPVNAALRFTGRQMYRGALRAPMSITEKTPNVVKQGIEDAIVVGPASAPKKAFAGVKTSKAHAARMRAEAQAAGAPPIDRSELHTEILPIHKDAALAARAGAKDETPAVARRMRGIPQQSTLDEGAEFGRVFNNRSDQAFKAARRGGHVASVDAQVDKALASGYRKAQETRVPGLRDVNDVTNTRFGLGLALRKAAQRPHVLANLIAGGAGLGAAYGGGDWQTGLGAAMTMKALTSPRALSATGIMLDRTGKFNVPIQMLRAALLARLQGTTEETPR